MSRYIHSIHELCILERSAEHKECTSSKAASGQVSVVVKHKCMKIALTNSCCQVYGSGLCNDAWRGGQEPSFKLSLYGQAWFMLCL